MSTGEPRFVSRGGIKLAAALDAFEVDVTGLCCADLGSNVGGFVDCLLQRGATRVYAIDTGYGVLDYRLRKDSRVHVMERTNALHAELPEPADLITIDMGWTRQRHALPAALRLLKPGGRIITLIKPQYEADTERKGHGVLPPEISEQVLQQVLRDIPRYGCVVLQSIQSPIVGQAGNREYLALLEAA